MRAARSNGLANRSFLFSCGAKSHWYYKLLLLLLLLLMICPIFVKCHIYSARRTFLESAWSGESKTGVSRCTCSVRCHHGLNRKSLLNSSASTYIFFGINRTWGWESKAGGFYHCSSFKIFINPELIMPCSSLKISVLVFFPDEKVGNFACAYDCYSQSDTHVNAYALYLQRLRAARRIAREWNALLRTFPTTQRQWKFNACYYCAIRFEDVAKSWI